MGTSYQVALITGASSGIGREMALQLAKQGVKVGLIARRQEKLEEIATEIRKRGGECAIACGDVTSEEQVQKAVDKITKSLGPVDLLIANAGISTGTRIENFRMETVESVYKINVFGAMYAINAVVQSMIERRKGHIVGIASVAGFRGFPVKSAYCGSKAALRVQLEGLRAELAAYDVTVSTICPGFIKSEMTDGVNVNMPFLMDTERAVTKMLGAIHAKRTLYIFPWQMAIWIAILRSIPSGLFYRFGAYLKRKNKNKARNRPTSLDRAA